MEPAGGPGCECLLAGDGQRGPLALPLVVVPVRGRASRGAGGLAERAFLVAAGSVEERHGPSGGVAAGDDADPGDVCGVGELHARAWRSEGLPVGGPDAILLASGSGVEVGGLYAVLTLLGGVVRRGPASLFHPLTADGPGAICAAWVQTEGGVLAVSLDGQLPGMAEAGGELVVEALDAGDGRIAWAAAHGGERWVFVGGVRDPRRLASLERGATRVVR